MIGNFVRRVISAVGSRLIVDEPGFGMNLTYDDVDQPKMSYAMRAMSSTRNFILDSNLEDPQDLFEILGLPPISDEVLEMEQRESEERIGRVAVLSPALEAYAMTMATAITTNLAKVTATANNGEIDADTATRWVLFSRTLEGSIYAALLGSMSQMVEHELVEIAPDLVLQVTCD